MTADDRFDHVDVAIVGAGISGVCAAYSLKKYLPKKSFVILENRERIGGTWDLHRFPGVRADTAFHPLAFSFRPWRNPLAMVPGEQIREYIVDTAKAYKIDEHIRFRHKIVRASWDSNEAKWTLHMVKRDEEGREQDVQLTCNFLFLGTGWYKYSQGHIPDFEGVERFNGSVVHPQHWPEDLAWHGKRVVLIGSGATAVSMVPSLAEKSDLTWLQRSPSYIIPAPRFDPLYKGLLGKLLPTSWVFRLSRWRNILRYKLYWMLRGRPRTSRILVGRMRKLLPADYDVETHFTPRYAFYEQRPCIVPDGDVFTTIREGKVQVVTDHVDHFTASGIKVGSGRELEADVVVSATGFQLEFVGGIELQVDGRKVNLGKTFVYKGLMYSDVPNLAYIFGYLTFQWTLGAELRSRYVCRLLKYMDKKGHAIATPRPSANLDSEPWLPFSSTYARRALETQPKQGPEEPWRQSQEYLGDFLRRRFGRINDGHLQFSNPTQETTQETPEEEGVGLTG